MSAPGHLTALAATRARTDRGYRQEVVYDWVKRCFGEANLVVKERALRLVEEAIELAQAEGIDVRELWTLVTYVYSKPPGTPEQEAGGIGTTLLAYAEAKGFSADDAEWNELDRILSKPVEHFRARHDKKAEAGIAKKVVP